jgi:hypothetical protein
MEDAAIKTTDGQVDIEADNITVYAIFKSVVNHAFYSCTTSTWPAAAYTRILNWDYTSSSGQTLTYSDGFFTNNLGYAVYVSIDFSGHRATGSGDSNYRIVANSIIYNQGTVPGQAYASISASVYLPVGTSFFIEGLHTTGPTQDFGDGRLTFIIQH